jgi:hypothetical protein
MQPASKNAVEKNPKLEEEPGSNTGTPAFSMRT